MNNNINIANNNEQFLILVKENKKLKLKVNEYKNKLHICNQKLIELLQYK